MKINPLKIMYCLSNITDNSKLLNFCKNNVFILILPAILCVQF